MARCAVAFVIILGIGDCLGAHLSLNSVRNNTGHWVAQVMLHDGNATSGENILDMDLGIPQDLKLRDPELPAQKKKLGFLKFHCTPMTWLQAKKTCDSEGGNLLVLNSEREFTTVKAIWESYPQATSYLHLGLNDLYKDGHFLTIDGQTVEETGYDKWKPNEPSNGLTANCLRVNKDGFLLDSYCTNEYVYFCEI
ncbi:hypothetical protein C0J52_08849 [Blattella germanica]|nr:hypothetical protein C0J52_08849 [Blattella germanica]